MIYHKENAEDWYMGSSALLQGDDVAIDENYTGEYSIGIKSTTGYACEQHNYEVAEDSLYLINKGVLEATFSVLVIPPVYYQKKITFHKKDIIITLCY